MIYLKQNLKFQNLPLPLARIENEEELDVLQAEGIKNFFTLSNIIDVYTRFKIFLGLKVSGHTDALTE